MKIWIYLIVSLIGLSSIPVNAQSVSQKYVKEQEAAKKKQADLVKQSTQKKKN